MKQQRIGEPLQPLNRTLWPAQPPKAAASREDEIARQAIALIEREDGFDMCADHRLRGAYDGDHEHRIAMKAIELYRLDRRA